MLTLRSFRSVRWLMLLMCFCMLWLEVGPVYSETIAYQKAEEAARPKPKLPNILLHSRGASLQSVTHLQPKAPDVQDLSFKQMSQIRGRGLLRNPYFNGTLPWQRSFHDVNMSNGNLFKSYTDIQVAAAQGAGLALQRTYNSNDATIGPFGIGWTHAYDIQMQEATDVAAQSGTTTSTAAINSVPRTDFFGGKHNYHRDADGLYTPPPYLYDQLSSNYAASLVDGPLNVQSDTDVSQDGTVKHYTNEVTNADGSSGNDRMCDYIQDRHGNRTVLAYNKTVTQADGSTRNLLTSVTDPVGRSLVFTWSNVGTAGQPAWRITQVQGPFVNGVATSATYIVTYDYYTDTTNPASCYNLKDVRLDSAGLNRTTTFTYTSFTGSNSTGTSTENGLLSTITDPLGHVTSYAWGMSPARSMYWIFSYNNGILGTVYVTQESEPGSNGVQTYDFCFCGEGEGQFPYGGYGNDVFCAIFDDSPTLSGAATINGTYLDPILFTEADTSLRFTQYRYAGGQYWEDWIPEQMTYDADNNVIDDLKANQIEKISTFGQVGNVLTQQFNGYPAQDTTTYYNASQYFQKQSGTDMDGHTTTYGVGTNTAGNSGDPDPNIGDRGEVLWVQDAGFNDPNSPSYGRRYSNTYNQFGQKLTGMNLTGTATQNTYGTANNTIDGYYDLGNLTQVVQDPGVGHLNRTTSMHYDAAGRVIQSTDPKGLTTNFTYNSLGQPLTVQTPATGTAPAEAISYQYEEDGRTHSVTDNRGTTVVTYEDEHYGDYTNYGSRIYSVSDPVTGAIKYSYLCTGEKATETLPSGVIWNYKYSMPLADGNAGPTLYCLPKDDPNSATRWLLGIYDSQGRAVNVLHDQVATLAFVQFNLVNNSSGNTVALDETDDQYDGGYIASQGAGSYATPSGFSRGNLAMRTTSAFHTVSGSSYPVGQTLCENSYTYDNASNRLSNTVSMASTSASGAIQYSGGTPATGGVAYDTGYPPRELVGAYGQVPDLYDFEYQSITNQLSTSRTETYGYDDLNRLSAVSYGDGESQTYSFDSMGNRLAKSDSVTQSGNTTSTSSAYTYDAANRLTGVSQNVGTSTTVTSDADGNTLSDSSGRTYIWDSQNRLISCTYHSQTTTFSYGSDGLRRSMTVNSVTTDYAYDGTMLVQEFQTNAQTGQLAATATYMQGPSGPICRINESNQTEGYYPAGVSSNAPLARGVTRWYVYDGLGSKIAELDDNNNMTSSGLFDVYGLPRVGTQQGVAATSSQGYVGSLGHVTDQSTGGLIYMQARYYDPSLGRFVSEDPGRNGANWFVYAADDPVNHVDKNGKFWIIILAAIVDGIASGIADCETYGWSWKNFGIGFACGAVTGAASCFGPGAGAAAGAITGALDSLYHGANPLYGALGGAVGGGLGGLVVGPETAALSKNLVLYLLCGFDEGAVQGTGQVIANNW